MAHFGGLKDLSWEQHVGEVDECGGYRKMQQADPGMKSAPTVNCLMSIWKRNWVREIRLKVSFYVFDGFENAQFNLFSCLLQLKILFLMPDISRQNFIHFIPNLYAPCSMVCKYDSLSSRISLPYTSF